MSLEIPDPVSPDQLARLRCAPEFFTRLLSIGHQGKGTGRFRVIEHGLPGDVRVEHISVDNGDVTLILRSCAFAPVAEGSEIPLLESPTFEHVTE